MDDKDDEPVGIRRLCVAVDIDSEVFRTGEEMEFGQRRLAMALAEACSSPGLDRMLLTGQDPGSAELALLPVGIDEPRAVASLIGGLVRALSRINSALEDNARVRLRMALHEGITILTAEGFTGQAVAKTRRLLGSRPLRVALMRNQQASLAVMLSEQLFEDVGQFDHPGLPAGQFKRVEIDGPPGGSLDVGWIYVLGEEKGGGSVPQQAGPGS